MRKCFFGSASLEGLSNTCLAVIAAGVLFAIEDVVAAEGLRSAGASHMVVTPCTASALTASGLHAFTHEEGGRIMADNRLEFIKERLAPCGLHCGRCFAFVGGRIQVLSSQLQSELGNFGAFAKRFADLLGDSIFESYPDFKKFLDHLAKGGCGGCRQEKCKLFASCGVRPCAEGRKVDFCFQCSDFPCDKTGFDEHLYRRHVEINRKMKEIGVERYYEEVRHLPRY